MTLAQLEAAVWGRVPDLVAEWTEKTAAPAWDIRQATSMAYTHGDIGFYWHPLTEKAAMFFRAFPRKNEVAMCKMALDRAVGVDHVLPTSLTFDDLVNDGWVKVAYSKTLRRGGELLNFFPGKYPGGLPNAPSPLAATLTGGLVGAGLGYGVGALGERLLPAR